MDDEVLSMINDQYKRAKQILTEHKEGHQQLAELLYNKEVIYAEDVEKIFGKRPWVSRSEEIMEENDALEKAKEKASEPQLEDMPDVVKQAQAEHEAAMAKGNEVPSLENKDDNKQVDSNNKPHHTQKTNDSEHSDKEAQS
jgi:cell division protease FtsH